jgi:hypothetical protein
MFQSRRLEKPVQKTKFRKQAEEEVRDKQKKKQQQKQLSQQSRGYDMWGNDEHEF